MIIAGSLILFGILIALQNFFGVNFPTLRVGLGILLMYGGLRLVLGSFQLNLSQLSNEYRAILTTSALTFPNLQKSTKFYILFARSDLDLRKVDISRGDEELNLYVLFGRGLVRVDLTNPLTLNIHASFSKITDPGSKLLENGSFSYKSNIGGTGRPTKLILNVHSVIGRLEFFSGE